MCDRRRNSRICLALVDYVDKLESKAHISIAYIVEAKNVVSCQCQLDFDGFLDFVGMVLIKYRNWVAVAGLKFELICGIEP